jgi:hypothetical protein
MKKKNKPIKKLIKFVGENKGQKKRAEKMLSAIY